MNILKEYICAVLSESTYSAQLPTIDGYYWCRESGGEPFIVLVRKTEPLSTDHPAMKYRRDNNLPEYQESWDYDICGSDEGFKPSAQTEWKGPLTP